MKTKKIYQQPEIMVVEIEEQIIAASNWDAQSIDLELDLDNIEEEGYGD